MTFFEQERENTKDVKAHLKWEGKLLGKTKVTFWLNSRKERRSEREGGGGPSRGDGLGACWHMHIALLICICLSLSLLTLLVVFVSLLLSILSETGCHSHHLCTILFLFSIFRSLCFPSSPMHPLFLSERRCLWLAPSIWLIKKAGRLTWRRRKHWCHFLIMYLFLKRAQCVRASLSHKRTGNSPPYWTGGQMFHYCAP